MAALLSITAYTAVFRPGAAVIFRIKTAILIQNLCVGKPDLFPGFGIYADFHVTGDFLPEVCHNFAFGSRKDAGRRNPFLLADFFALLFNQRFIWPVKGLGCPGAWRDKGSVVNLSVIDLREADRTFGNGPAFIRDDEAALSVLIGDFQLCQQPHGAGGQALLEVRCGKSGHGTVIPALSDGDSQTVLRPE